jgi:hypothetical protein
VAPSIFLLLSDQVDLVDQRGASIFLLLSGWPDVVPVFLAVIRLAGAVPVISCCYQIRPTWHLGFLAVIRLTGCLSGSFPGLGQAWVRLIA